MGAVSKTVWIVAGLMLFSVAMAMNLHFYGLLDEKPVQTTQTAVQTVPNGNPPAVAVIEPLRQSAPEVDVEEMLELGEAYSTGNGVPRDLAAAEAQYRAAHERQNLKATVRLAQLLAMRGDPEAKTLLEQAVLRSSGEGQYYFAKYIEQHGKNDPGAAEQIDKALRGAAKNGYAPAQFELGLAYEFGRAQKFDGPSVVNRPGTAESWHLAAAEQGHRYAQLQLGLIYMEGRYGVERDPAKAKLWLDRAAEQGLTEVDEIANPSNN